jgi:HPt (histidine-containing phosphotransfer) domain-containing protein
VLSILPVKFKLLPEFEQQINSKEPAAAINAAHTIKGVAANIGGPELQVLCSEMGAWGVA